MDSKKKTNKTRCRACPASGFCSDVCYNRDVPDVTCAHAVKYDKLNKRVASLEGQMETVKFMPLKQRDTELEKLWDEFADVPMNPDTEKMEGAFLHFPAGTPREDIWHWFDERYSKGIAALLYGRGEDNTATIATLTYRNELCCECDSELCAFADASGICRAPFITGAAPRIHEDGCDDFCSKCDAGCTASVADKASEAGRYMVFTDGPYVRDAQIYCGTIDEDEDIYSEENEDNWYDTSGPVLLIDRDFKTLDELRKTVMDVYPDMDLCTLRAMRVSGKAVCL